MAAQLIIDKRKPFLRFTLNRPAKGNLISARMMLALSTQLRALSAERGYRAVVIQGAGKDFCLGREPKPVAGGKTDTAHNSHASVMSVILDVYTALRECSVPVITAVHGRAHGFRCGLAGASDLVLASDDMVYSGKSVDAHTALAIGIASRVVPAQTLSTQLDVLLASMAAHDEHAVRYIKGFADKPGHMSPQALSDLAGYTLATAFTRPR
jgi:enoyl-CoA hydratase